ncbi:MAG: efflux RND transporter periplasmic adaptor subunit [Isosphaeraceae bacterium]
MASGEFGAVLDDMQVLFDQGTAAGLADVELLARFLADRGAGGESAFAALVTRHGPMVLRVCRGELNDLHAAEDAFQATFLVLARQARSIRERSSLSSWLFGVARRVARRARRDRARRLEREQKGALMLDHPGRERLAPEPPELLPEVQEEVDRLPERYRGPIVLCYLEGLTHEEAAGQLRIPVGTVKVRLSRGRDRLRGRLIRRGLAPAVIAVALEFSGRAAISASLVKVTVEAAMRVAAFQAAGVAASVAVLVQGVLRAMLIHKLRTTAVVLAASMGLLAASFVVVSALPTPAQSRQEPPRKAAPVAQKPAPAPAASPDDSVPEVDVVTIKKGTLHRTWRQRATVQPIAVVTVISRVSGTLKTVPVDIGSRVKKGQILAELDAPELKIEQARAEALAEHARARIKAAMAKVEVDAAALMTAQANLHAAETKLRGAENQRDFREKQFTRIEALVKRASIEPRMLDEEADRRDAARIEVETAKLELSAAKSRINEARARLTGTKAAVDELEQGVQLAGIDRDRARLMGESAQIRSPIDGLVTARNFNVGEFVRSADEGGSRPLFTVVDTRIVRIVTGVPERDVPLVDLGDPAIFLADVFPSVEFKGVVSRIAESMDANERTMRVEIDLKNEDHKLRAGMFGQVEIRLDTLPDRIVIPGFAVAQDSVRGSFCYKVVNGHAISTPLTLGDLTDEGYVVRNGLNAGDTLILQPQAFRDNQKVRPRPVRDIRQYGRFQ